LSTQFILWLAAIGACAAIAFQWVLLRSNYLKAIAQQRARHQHQQQATHTQLELAKQQIGRLQHDLSITRMHVKRQVAREQAVAPLREEPTAAAARHAVPPDGFADTLPALQFPHDVSLLKH
jgi:heme exporter protein D